MIKTLEVASYQENGQLYVKWLYLFGQGQNYLGKWPARPAIWIIIWATFILKWPIISNNLLIIWKKARTIRENGQPGHFVKWP